METLWLPKNVHADSYPRTDPIIVPAIQPRIPKLVLSNPHTKAAKRKYTYYNYLLHIMHGTYKISYKWVNYTVLQGIRHL